MGDVESELKIQINQLLKKGVIVPSSSPWAGPAILIKKKVAPVRHYLN